MRTFALLILFFVGIYVSTTSYASPSDSINKSFYKKDLEGIFSLDTSYQVLGFHPYWMNNSYKHYNYSLLSMVAYLSYELEPTTGNYKDLHQWQQSEIIEVAHTENPHCKVLLTITNFGEKNNSIFLNNPGARERLIKNVLHEIKLKNGEGVIIDFEKLAPKDKSVFSEFIKELKSAFQKENRNLIIGITLPAFDRKDCFDEARLSALSDWMIVMSYEREDSVLQRAGPIAPLKNSTKWQHSITSSIDQYIKDGIPAKKIILAVAYYGEVWKIMKASPDQRTAFMKYNAIKKQFKNMAEIDEVSLSAVYNYSKNHEPYQCWFEDSISLGYKYDFIKERKLGGIGIFALGYDSGRPELWNLLQKKFSSTEIKKNNHDSVITKTEERKAAELKTTIDQTNNTRLIFIIVLLIVLIFILFRKRLKRNKE